jgi:hypothetical protein
MAKFKCLDSECGQFFDGDMATMQCPHCGSTEFKKVGGTIPWKVIGIIGGVLIAIIIIVALLIPSPDQPVASMEEKDGQILVIEVKNVKETKLKSDYKLVVYDETNGIHQVLNFNGKTNLLQYDISYMLSGMCYNFALERKDGKHIDNLRWTTSTQYCVPLPPAKPVIKSIEIGAPDVEKQVYKKVTIYMEEEGDFTYVIGDIKQSSPEFMDLKPGDYTVYVSNSAGVKTSQEIILNKIKRLPPPLTLAQIQSVFDKVSRGAMSASVAQDSLANGNVNLSTTIQPGDIQTLWGALMEAAMGESFVIGDFQNNPNTNKIKSGTLKLSRK